MEKKYFELFEIRFDIKLPRTGRTILLDAAEIYNMVTCDGFDRSRRIGRFETPEEVKAAMESMRDQVFTRRAADRSYLYGMLLYSDENTYEISEDGSEEWIDGDGGGYIVQQWCSASDGPETIWYAVILDHDDDDWGTGSFDRDTAELLAAETAEWNGSAIIASIDVLGNVCISEEVVQRGDAE